jgi:type IV pilus assembly protein PilX
MNQHVNYSAQSLATDVRGIPLVLLGQSNFDNAKMDARADLIDLQSAVQVRTVIDRLCTSVGPYNPATCTNLDPAVGQAPESCDTHDCIRRKAAELPVYRISVRATGPRNTQVFLQTTLAR